MTPNQAREKIRDHLEKGMGIYAYGPGPSMGQRFFEARVHEGRLEAFDGDCWRPVPFGTKFYSGLVFGTGHLFTYNED